MPTFDLVVVGCGGGPDESNLSSYLFKPSHLPWSSGTVALEAGSGLGALRRILQANPTLFGTRTESEDDMYSAAEVLSWIKCYLITHAHMDHINGLVLYAGSIPGGPRRVYAVHSTLVDIQTVFSDRIWPNLASWDATRDDVAYTYTDLDLNSQYKTIHAGLSVCTMPLSHGRERVNNTTFDSAAFFIRDDASSQEFLFFGDVEPDSVSLQPRLRDVWCIAALKIPQSLSTIFIECSYPLGRRESLLHGHLSPEHLCTELSILAEEVFAVQQRATGEGHGTSQTLGSSRTRKKQKRNPVTPEDLRGVLRGVRVYITHCKSDLQHKHDRPMHNVIADQVRSLIDERGLGAEIFSAYQGMQISF